MPTHAHTHGCTPHTWSCAEFTWAHTHLHTRTPAPQVNFWRQLPGNRSFPRAGAGPLLLLCLPGPKELGKQASPALPGRRGWCLPHWTLGTLSSSGSFSQGLCPPHPPPPLAGKAVLLAGPARPLCWGLPSAVSPLPTPSAALQAVVEPGERSGQFRG